MRRPVKPFAVEVRRAGRRVPQAFIPPRVAEEAPQPDYFTLGEPGPQVATPPALSLTPGPAPAPQAPPRRVLQDLNEAQHDPVAERLLELESRLARRGRPRGSKNKTQRSQPLFDLGEFLAPLESESAAMLIPLPFKRRPAEQRFSWIKKELQRGERWKRRLPKIVW
jgi:hypothetical protein